MRPIIFPHSKMPPHNSKLLLLIFTFLSLFSSGTTKAQIQNKRILIKSGSGKFSLKNTEPILISFDLSMYQKGHINYIVKMAGGDGISSSGGRCEAAIGLARRAEYPKIINPDYLPVGASRVGDLGADLIKPENFILVLIPLCYNDPLRIGEYTYEIYLEKYEPLTCPPRTSETNPAEPVYNNKIQDENYDDWRDNGKTFDIAPAGTKFGGDNDSLFVNDIGMTRNAAEYMGFEIQKTINSPVRLLYNNSSLDGAVTLALNKYQKEKPPTPFLQQLFVNPFVSEVFKFQDFVTDEKTAHWAKTNVLHNPLAAQSLAQEILNRASRGKRVNLIVHSQGAAIAAEALRLLHQCLGEKSAGTLKNVRVLSIGDAASSADFPPNVSVSSLYHKTDSIALGFGENHKNFTSDSLKYLLDTAQHTNYFDYKADDGTVTKGDQKVREWVLK